MAEGPHILVSETHGSDPTSERAVKSVRHANGGLRVSYAHILLYGGSAEAIPASFPYRARRKGTWSIGLKRCDILFDDEIVIRKGDIVRLTMYFDDVKIRWTVDAFVLR